jgi:hypothetical protein
VRTVPREPNAQNPLPGLEKATKTLLASGIPPLDVAERYPLPLILVHAIDLHGREDQERLQRLGITLHPYDVWTLGRCDDLYGEDWPDHYTLTELGREVLACDAQAASEPTVHAQAASEPTVHAQCESTPAVNGTIESARGCGGKRQI